jgi:predicted  nucleic acid-binding Zn-ribbon protein
MLIFDKEMIETSDLEKESSSELILHIKGEAHSVSVNCNEDIDAATERVLTTFKLKPEMKVKIEAELLRTKVDALQLLEAKLKHKLSISQRQSGILATYEKTASLAEAHVAEVSTSYKQIDQLLPQFENAISKAMAKIKMLEHKVEVWTPFINITSG